MQMDDVSDGIHKCNIAIVSRYDETFSHLIIIQEGTTVPNHDLNNPTQNEQQASRQWFNIIIGAKP